MDAELSSDAEETLTVTVTPVVDYKNPERRATIEAALGPFMQKQAVELAAFAKELGYGDDPITFSYLIPSAIREPDGLDAAPQDVSFLVVREVSERLLALDYLGRSIHRMLVTETPNEFQGLLDDGQAYAQAEGVHDCPDCGEHVKDSTDE